MANNQLAKRRILNALSDLYYIRRHAKDMTDDQSAAVDAAIDALEKEYLALGGRAPEGAYSGIADGINSARDSLNRIKDERIQLTNDFTTAAKILGSISSILSLPN